MEIVASINSYRHCNESKDFFSDLDININSNGIYFLIGASGIGKTTLLNILLGLQEGKLKGNVEYKNDKIMYSPIALRKQGLVGYMSQDSSLIPWLDVENNLFLPSKVNKNLKAPSMEFVKEILKSLNFELDNGSSNLLKKYGNQLSFGMKARIGLARVLMYKPKILVLDELFTGTDAYTNDCISNYLHNIKNDLIAFCVSHNLEQAFQVAKKIIVLNGANENRVLTTFNRNEFNSHKSDIINLLNN